MVAESAFGLAEHLGEDLVFEVCVGVDVVDDVDDVLGEEVRADYAADLAFAVFEVGGPGVSGYHFGDSGEGVRREVRSEGRWKVLLIREVFSTLLAWGVETVASVVLGR